MISLVAKNFLARSAFVILIPSLARTQIKSFPDGPLMPGDSFRLSTALDTSTVVTLTLPPPMKAPQSSSPNVHYAEALTRVIKVMSVSGNQISKFELVFEKVDEILSDDAITNIKTDVKAGSSSVGKRILVSCIPTEDVSIIEGEPLTAQETAIAKRECINIMSSVTALRTAINRATRPQTSSVVSPKVASSLLGGRPVAPKAKATMTFDKANGDGLSMLKLVIVPPPDDQGRLVLPVAEDRESDGWEGTVSVSNDHLHLTTSATSHKVKNQQMGTSNSILKSNSDTTLSFKEDVEILSAKQ